MKKILSVVLVATLLGMTVACGSATEPKESNAVKDEMKDTADDKSADETKENVAFEPSHDFNIRVPFAAGGSLDTIVRIYAQGLQQEYGKTVTVNNLTGAFGAISAADLAKSPAEVTNMMAGGIAMFTLAPLFNKDVHMDMEDYHFVTGLVKEDFILFVNPEKSGIENFEGLKEYGKDNRVVFGSNRPGGTTHLLQTMLFAETGINAEAVTSDGSAKDLLALAGGNVDCAVATASLGAQYVEEGSLVPILVFSEDAYEGYEGYKVPTAKEDGEDIVFQACNFLMTKKGVDIADAEAVRQAMIEYSKTEEFKKLAENASYTPSLDDGLEVRKTIEAAKEMCEEAYEKYYK